MSAKSPLSNERHDIYVSGARSNSLTSFTSFTSTSNMSTISTATNNKAPRLSTTNDLLFMESRFTKPSRVKHQFRPMQTPISDNSHGYLLPPRSLPRASSVPSVPHLVQNPPQGRQPRLNSFTNQQYPRLRSSTSMHHVPNYRRQSLKPSQSQPNVATMNHAGQNNFSQQQHQQQYQRRHSNRPSFHNATFTFPNGEIYTPRNKQRSSQTNLKTLNQMQPSIPRGFNGESQLAPAMTTPSYPQQQQPLTFSVSRPVAKSSFSEPVVSSISPPQSHTQPGDQDLSLLTTGSNSYSSSPSPSRTSRTNSSVNESTPPSSLDDLTIHTSTKADLSQLPPPFQHFDSVQSNNLDKIEENSDHETKTTISTPTSEVTEKTLEGQKPLDFEPLNASNESIDPKQPDPTYQQQQSVTESEDYQKSSSPSPAPAPQLKYQTLPQVQVKSSPAPITTTTPIIPQSAIKSSELQIERKKSLFKRIFSKVFTSDKKRSKIEKKNSLKTKAEVKTPHYNPQPIQSTPQIAKKVEPRVVPVQNHLLDSEIDHSDAFSFDEGDEDAGLKVQSDDKAEDSDSSDFKSELVLDKLFSRLSMNKSSEEVYKKLTDEKKRKREDPKDEEVKSDVKPSGSSYDADDDEDEIIQFDDMQLIDKIIEFGETPFPDLAATDLGQSQRKLQRSKSVERKKSIRSISSSSRILDEVIASPAPEKSSLKGSNIEVIWSNQPRDPYPAVKSRPSILKKTKSLDRKPSTKKVGFTNQIYVNNTYPSYIYNRHSRSLSSYSLSPQLIRQIRHEMNDFKRSMIVHESSLGNTHYFRA